MDRNLILNDSFNALVFEHRHKNYGAYQIRKRYSRSVLIAAFVATSIFTLAMGSYFIGGPKANAFVPPKTDSIMVIPYHIQDPPIDPPKPKPVTPPAPKGPKIDPSSTPVVVNHPVDPPKLSDSLPGDPNGKGHTQGPITSDPGNCDTCNISHNPPPVDPPSIAVSDPPTFDVQKWFGEHTKYPQRAKDENIEGVVYLQWIVDTDGKITDIVVAKSGHPWLDAEALRVAKLMPAWDPAKDNGKIVRFKFTMPVRFKLK